MRSEQEKAIGEALQAAGWGSPHRTARALCTGESERGSYVAGLRDLRITSHDKAAVDRAIALIEAMRVEGRS